MHAEGHAHVDLKHAGRLALVRRRRGDRVLKSFQIVPDLLEKALAGLGQGQLPGTAVK